MPMTLVVTRDVEDRYRGFLTSIMLEVAPGVYVAPNLSAGVRERLWTVLDAWWTELRRGAIVMAWREPKAVGGIGLRTLGEPPKEIVDADGVLLLKRL
jgi:CRISPR-associated protein Cas2